MSTSRRLQVRLTEEVASQVESLAREHAVSLSDSLRMLVGRGLAKPNPASDDRLTLAALVAAEHSLLLVASFLPDGQRRLQELGERAIAAAQDRVALLGDQEGQA